MLGAGHHVVQVVPSFRVSCSLEQVGTSFGTNCSRLTVVSMLFSVSNRVVGSTAFVVSTQAVLKSFPVFSQESTGKNGEDKLDFVSKPSSSWVVASTGYLEFMAAAAWSSRQRPIIVCVRVIV